MQIIPIRIYHSRFYCPFSGQLVVDGGETNSTQHLAGFFSPMTNDMWDITPDLCTEMVDILRKDIRLGRERFLSLRETLIEFSHAAGAAGDEAQRIKIKTLLQEVEKHIGPYCWKPPEEVIEMLEESPAFMKVNIFHHLADRISDRFITFKLLEGNTSFYIVFDVNAGIA